MSELYTTLAALYDAAFDWDVSHEVGSISGLSGLQDGRVLEPMCGSARLLRGFAAQGFETVGVDGSGQLLNIAESHYDRMGITGEWVQADVTSFDLDRACDLAVCPVNSLAHLPTESAMLAHLSAMSRNLHNGASYWLQLDLKTGSVRGAHEAWDFDYLGDTLRFEWTCADSDGTVETHVSRFVFPDGKVIEESHSMKVWSFETWSRLLAQTPFELSAAYAGTTFAPLPVDARLNGERVFWQQLVKLL